MEDEIKIKAQYAKNVLMSELIKIILIGTVSVCFGHGRDFFVILIFLLGIRTCLGGLHMASQAMCVLFSFIFFFLVIFLNQIVVKKGVFLILCLIMIAMIIWKAPIQSKEKPIFDRKQRKKFKMRGSVFIVLFYIMFLYFEKYSTLYFGLFFFS